MERPSRWRQHRDFSHETYPLSPQDPARYPEDGFSATSYGNGAASGQQSFSPPPRAAYYQPRRESHSEQQYQEHEFRSRNFIAQEPAARSYENLSQTDARQPSFAASGISQDRSAYDQARSDDGAGYLRSYASNVSDAQQSYITTDRFAYPPLPPHSSSNEEAPDGDDPYRRDANALANKMARAFRVKAWLYWMDRRYFHQHAFFGRRFPQSYQLPGYYYKPQVMKKKRHQDAFRRRFEGWDEDRFLDPLNGRVRKLFVQTVDETYEVPNDTSWRRTYIRNISPWLLRLAWWPHSHMPNAAVRGSNRHKRTVKGMVASFQSRVGDWDPKQWAQVAVYWLPACVGLLVLMCGPTSVEGQVRNHGNYDPVPYRYWSYPKSARNFYENVGITPTAELNHRNDLRLKDRNILPRYLCFLDCPIESPRGLMRPLAWMKSHSNRKQPNYILVSYTGQNQFGRRCKGSKKPGGANCNCLKCERSQSDADALHEIARVAAEQAGVEAYWTDQCCMSDNPVEFSEDIHGICDVVRNARRITVVLGRTGGPRVPSDTDTLTLLREWGSRMWTWPEVLLGPIKEKLYVYTRGLPLDQPWKVSKLNFAIQAWDDSAVARQLLDYYENTMTLSRLELVVLALESLKSRVLNGTTKFADGDLSYALMGLLRQRPKVEKTDSAFQAFARLSLANDSDRLLERMICLLPIAITSNSRNGSQSRGPTTVHQNPEEEPEEETELHSAEQHYWTNMNDYWGAKLWDIEPICQVAGIANNDTVILDGAYGATIHWDSFQRISITTRETWSRLTARFLVRGTPGWFFLGILLIAISGPPSSAFSSTKFVGVIFLILAIVLILLSPMLLLHIYSGKVWNSQPWLIGFEGHMDIREIERKIFGFPCERLSWAPYGSSLSRHKKDEENFIEDECEGMDPLLREHQQHDTTSYPQPVPTGEEDGEPMRHFTIVDTFTMTVAMCSAARPPVVALLCGSEGGMQRAVMCSYDWTAQTFYRETVLRMETRVLERMPRIGRVRFGMRKWRDGVVKVESRLTPP